MCGIAGILHFRSEPVERERLGAMTSSLSHRGPDGEGLYVNGRIGLGHRRLAIRDLTEAGRQPMSDPSGTIIVSYNGEIYNDLELRACLEAETGHTFTTGCDTEVLPVGWRAWGEELFDRIEGMFAVALWDARTQTLLLARDPVGIKPLYYMRSEGAMIFASEIKALLVAATSRPKVDRAALHQYLACGYPSPASSLLDGIRQVAPGAVLRVQGDSVEERVRWRPARTGEIVEPDVAEKALDEALSTVCAQMRCADVPLGLMLSSGVDSALLASVTSGSIPCYTATFAERSHDESQGARRIAENTGHAWHAVMVEGGVEPCGQFERMVHHLDGQLADSSAFAHFAISEAIARDLKVALAGDGADEFFAGYPTYHASMLADRLGWVPRVAAQSVARVLSERIGGRDESRVPPREKAWRFLAGLGAPFGEPHVEWRRLLSALDMPALYGPAMREFVAADPLAEYRAAMGPASAPTLDRCLLADQRFYLPADMLVKVDRMSMAHGLEVRVPFLDRRIMDLAGRLDSRLLTSLGRPTKNVLRSLLMRRGDPGGLARAPKKGFNVPVSRLLRVELRPLCERFLDREADVFSPLLDSGAVRTLWQDHLARRRNHGYLLWALLVWASWSTSTGIRAA